MDRDMRLRKVCPQCNKVVQVKRSCCGCGHCGCGHSVCHSVCLSGHAILAVRAIKSIMKDTIVLSVRFAAILKWRFS